MRKFKIVEQVNKVTGKKRYYIKLTWFTNLFGIILPYGSTEIREWHNGFDMGIHYFDNREDADKRILEELEETGWE